jgi:FixJ family two-component response regulator
MSDPVVYLVEDEPEVARWMSLAVATLGYPSEWFATGGSFLARTDLARTGCIVLDVMLPDMSGLEVQERLAARHNTLPLVIVTGGANIPLCVEAMQRGAFHFLEKPLPPQQFIQIVGEAVARSIATRDQAEEQLRRRALLERLSPDDRQLLSLIAEGLVNKELAARFDVSVRTIQARIQRLMLELGATTRFALAKLAGGEESDKPSQAR